MNIESDHSIEAEVHEEESPPQYELHRASGRMLSGTAAATDDGRIAVNLDSKFAQVFASLFHTSEEGLEAPPVYVQEDQPPWTIPLNIVVQVVGSRGDVQPFIALGVELQKFGHRVRIATHDVFKTFVQESGLEFFPIGGDPSELMAYMVKYPGLMPNMTMIREGEIPRKRKMISTMLHGCWRACIEPDPDTQTPFVANAIIANPPSFAHLHCAQALSIPLHMVFTMPWSPTRAFPHPLANIQNTITDPKTANYLSYNFVQALTWQGLADVINNFRNDLGLPDVPVSEGPFLAETLRIPHSYCWSTALVPRPIDWPEHIDVSGFIFRDPPQFTPPADFFNFLEQGPAPIYIGFGSIVVERPEVLLTTVLEAVKICGVRAIVSKGWSKLDAAEVSDEVLFVGDCPHEWLFQHVTAVVHHGGAGTTAAGLLYGKPTTVVPFFGDQPFWGDMIHAAGAGPQPIPHKKLTAIALVEAIQYCLTPDAVNAAQRLAERMKAEKGAASVAASFHKHLNVERLRCDFIPTQPAVYKYTKRDNLKLSSYAADVLVRNGRIKQQHLDLWKTAPFQIENRRWDPATATTSMALGVAFDVLKAGNTFWSEPRKVHKRRKEAAAIAAAADVDADPDDPGEGSSSTSITTTTTLTTQSKHVAKLAGHSLLAFPKLFGIMLKSVALDAPLAVTEGLRSTPKLYGETVPDHAAITDWKSGLVVAGKDSSKMMAKGLVDIAVQPYRGAKDDGIRGFAIGVGKGTVGALTKTMAGGVGMVAYPAQGAYRSLFGVMHGETRERVGSAWRVYDLYFVGKGGMGTGVGDEERVLVQFDGL